MEKVINDVLFTEEIGAACETLSIVLFGVTTMLELIFAISVVGSNKLEMTEEETLTVAVLVINVEFSDAWKNEDDARCKVEFPEGGKNCRLSEDLLMLTALDDRICPELCIPNDIVLLILTAEEVAITVLF